MTEEQLRQILSEIRSGALADDDALQLLRNLPFEDLGFAKLDHHRTLRRGAPEAVYGAGKTPEEIEGLARTILAHGQTLLVTKTTRAVFERIRAFAPDAAFHERSGLVVAARAPHPHAALLLADFILGPESQSILEKLEYGNATKDYGFKRWYPERGLSTAQYDRENTKWEKILRDLGRK